MATYTRQSVGAYRVRNTQPRTTTGRTWYSPIPFISVVLTGGSWVFTWATGTGPVRVVLWGKVIDTTTDNEYTYPASSQHATPTVAPPLEVWPSGVPAVSERNKPYVVLQWYRVACRSYTVEYYDGSAWVFVNTVVDSVDIPLQTFVTPILPDEAGTQWRVTAVDDNRRRSDPVTFHQSIGRPPDVPALPQLACTGGTLTVQ